LVTKRKTSTSPKLNDGRDDNSDPVKSGKQQKSNSSESTTEDKKGFYLFLQVISSNIGFLTLVLTTFGQSENYTT